MSDSFLAAVAVRAAHLVGDDVSTMADAFAVFDVGDGSTPSSPRPLPLPPLPPPHTELERFAELIRAAPPQSVIVLVGAGASVSAGIPCISGPPCSTQGSTASPLALRRKFFASQLHIV